MYVQSNLNERDDQGKGEKKEKGREKVGEKRENAGGGRRQDRREYLQL